VQSPSKQKRKKIKLGVDNDVYATELNGKKVIEKHYTKKNFKEVKEIIAITSQINTNTISVPTIFSLSKKNGSPIVTMERLSGNHVCRLNTLQLKQAGRLMARLHAQKISTRKQYFISSTDALALQKECKPKIFQNTIRKLHAKTTCTELNTLPKSFVHADFSPSNLLIKSKKITGLLDFDHSCISYSLSDIVRAQIFFSFNQDASFSLTRCCAFVRAYEEVRELTDNERQNFFPLMSFHLIKMFLETYYYVAVRNEVSVSLFKNNPWNQSYWKLYKKMKTLEKMPFSSPIP
jgi:Ser/Thr protein kinase RdoA (MazF antagonist)